MRERGGFSEGFGDLGPACPGLSPEDTHRIAGGLGLGRERGQRDP